MPPREDSRPPPAPPCADLFPWSTRWTCALIFGATLLAYLPALPGGFIWDDAGHVTRLDLQSLSGLGRIWFEIGATQQYYPFLHSAFWVEHHLWREWAPGYHLLNVLLHATAACLLGLTLQRLLEEERARPLDPLGALDRANGQVVDAVKGTAADIRKSADSLNPSRRQRGVASAWLAALLFALHPVCVESVAWIAEQKNTLSTVLYFSAALAYLRFDEKRKAAPYALATGLFVAALLTKTVTATLPAALLVVFWWKRGRLSWRRDVMPLAPWFALAAAAGWLTAWFERTRIGAQGADFALTLVQRCLLAGRVVWFYLGKLFWPADLMFIYPRWTMNAAAIWQWLFPLAALALVIGLWLGRRRGALAGWLFFGGTLFPALGFINVFPFLFSFVADHFQYLACTGILTLVASGFVSLVDSATQRDGRNGPSSRAKASLGTVDRPLDDRRQTSTSIMPRLSLPMGRAMAALVLIALGILTWRQCTMYQSDFMLYETTLAKNPACWLAHNNLAEALANSGRAAEAIPHLEQALRLRPDFPEAENNLGDDLRQLGRPQEALAHFEHALRLQPAFAEAHNNRGVALMMTGRATEGMAEFTEALRLKPGYAMARFNLGLARADAGRPDQAIADFAAAVRLDPDFGDAELNWAVGLTILGRFPEAVPHFDRALQLAPGSPAAYCSYGRALAGAGRAHEAIRQYEQALALDPGIAEAHFGLAQALRQVGRTQEAEVHDLEGLRLNPDAQQGHN